MSTIDPAAIASEILDELEAAPFWAQFVLMARDKLDSELDGDYTALAIAVGQTVDVLLPFGAFKKLPPLVRDAAEAYDGPAATYLTAQLIELVQDEERVARIRARLGSFWGQIRGWHSENVIRREARRAARKAERGEG
jgi:hypothetical protein